MIQSPLLLSAIIALAMGAVNKWNGLVLAGIIVGLLGYPLGNYLGLGIAYLLRGAGVGL